MNFEARADLVFLGTAVATELVERPEDRAPNAGVSGNPDLYWTFAVSRVYKGHATTRQRVVLAGDPCGAYDFRIDHGYVVHACRDPDRARVNATKPVGLYVCGGTYEPDGVARLPPVTPGYPPEAIGSARAAPADASGQRDGWRRAIGAAAVALLAGGAIGFVAERRRRTPM